MRDAAATLRALRSFRGAPPAARAFLLARATNLPLGGLDPDLRALEGRVLSLGCGHGLAERYLAEVNPRVTQVDGLELDEARVAAAAAAPHPRVRVRVQDVTTLDAGGGYDAALAIDVLHHVPYEAHAPIAAALHRALRPGGVLLVKEIATEPAWQHRFNAVLDRLVSGDAQVRTRPPDELSALFEAAGFTEQPRRAIGARSPYPHVLLRLRRDEGRPMEELVQDGRSAEEVPRARSGAG